VEVFTQELINSLYLLAAPGCSPPQSRASLPPLPGKAP
jgi:hypothetical protein